MVRARLTRKCLTQSSELLLDLGPSLLWGSTNGPIYNDNVFRGSFTCNRFLGFGEYDKFILLRREDPTRVQK